MNLEQQLKQTLERPAAMPEEAGAYARFLRHRRRRTRAVAAGAGLTLILLLTVAVTAPTLLSGGDRPAAGTGKPDRPGRLVRVAMEQWQVVRLDGRVLVVRFPGGPPGVPVGRCSPAYEATVSDGVQELYVTVWILLPPKTLPCPTPTMKHERTLTVVLPTPLGGRALLDGSAGEARIIMGTVVRDPSYLPPGYRQGMRAATLGRLGHRIAAWERVHHRVGSNRDELWITQGHPAALSLRYHPPVLYRTSVHGSPARVWRPVLGRGRSGLCLSWVEGATGFQVCSVGKPTPPLPIGELERVANGLR
jgi:hypothetical protein